MLSRTDTFEFAMTGLLFDEWFTQKVATKFRNLKWGIWFKTMNEISNFNFLSTLMRWTSLMLHLYIDNPELGIGITDFYFKVCYSSNFPYQGFAESIFEASTWIEKLETKKKIWAQCASQWAMALWSWLFCTKIWLLYNLLYPYLYYAIFYNNNKCYSILC